MTTPPDDLPRYRPLTGSDKESFSRHVSAALDLGYEPYGSPCVTSDGERVIFAQAVLRPGKTAAAQVVPGITADSILAPRDQDAADGIGPPSTGS